MRVIKSPKRLTAEIRRYKLKNKSVGFVPTMGALHEGHLSLIRRARKENDIVTVSIFVNPAQFGPREDLKKYPRPIKDDLDLCRKEKVDFVFYPAVKDMYPKGWATHVHVEGLSSILCGRSRPGHFRGVATVVTKLFNIVHPDIAYFGQKDAQQAAIIRKMAEDLHFPVKVKIMPIIRNRDGLALSSRNVYLTPRQRQDALVLSESLRLAKDLLRNGTRDSGKVIYAMRDLIRQKKTAKIDYIAVVDLKSLKPVRKVSRGSLIALAVRVGNTRLIDNMIV